MEVTKANLATYLAGLTPSATPYPIEITETVASDWGRSATAGTVGNIINTSTPNGVYLDLGLTRIPNSVSTVFSSFRGCTSLTTAPIIHNSVTAMRYTFYDCTSLTTAPIIPNSVVDMYFAFTGCKSLTTAPIIPSSVNNMVGTFEGCTALHTIQNFAVDVDNCDMTNAFYNCPALANIYVTTLTESSWHLLHTDTDATGTDYTIYNPDGTVAGSGTVAGTSQVLTLYGKSDELVISANITPTLAEETATTQVQWHKSGLPYDDELMIFNAKNPDTVISNFITVNRAGEEFLGNANTATTAQTAQTATTAIACSGNSATADKWKTARNVSISDADGTNTGTAVSVDGSENETLKLPATIKASITGNVTGNASTATAPFYQWKKLHTDLYRYAAGESPALTYYWYKVCKITTPMVFDIEVVSDNNYPYRASYRLSVSTSSAASSYSVSLFNLGQALISEARLAVALDADGYLYLQTKARWECALFVTLLYSSTSSFTVTMDKLGYAPFGTESGFTPVNLITQTGAFRWTTSGTLNTYTPIINTNIVGNVTGNASTATKLATARKINGVDFDGTADVYDTYSTTETRIGTWIDGKPLYRKVVSLPFVENVTARTTVGVANMGVRFIDLSSTYIVGTYGYRHPWKSTDMYVDDNGLLKAIVDHPDGTLVASIRYTKTTD